MDSQRIKYIRELKKAKISLEKQIKGLEKEIGYQREICDHLGIVFGDDTFRCVKCGLYEPSTANEVINATNLKDEDFDIVQDTIVEMLDQNPETKTAEMQQKIKTLGTKK